MNIRGTPTSRFLRAGVSYALLLLIALLCELYDLHLIYGITFSFASIFLLLMVPMYGIWAATAAAGIVYGIAIVGFHEPLIDLVGALEVGLVGILLLKRRHLLLLWDALFWLAIGIPLMFIAYYGYYHSFSVEVTLIVSIVAANGLFNALITDILLQYFPVLRWAGKSGEGKKMINFSQVLFHFSIGAVGLPFLIFIILNSWYAYNSVTQNSLQISTNTANGIKKELSRWDYEDMRGIRLSGRIQIGRLQDLVNRYTTESIFQVIITDDKHRVLAGNDPSLALKQVYDWKKDSNILQLGESFYQSVPRTSSLILPTEEWKNGSYFYSGVIEQIPLYIHIRIPIENYQKQIYQQYLDQIRYMLFCLVCAALFALFINRALVRSLSRLASTTTGLADKVYHRQEIEWPSSRILEISSLIDNFRHTSQNLLQMFHESLTMNNKLQEQTMMLRQSEEKLHELAYYDLLTGLPNRLSFTGYLQEMLSRSEEFKLPIAVMFADLNRFKQINDSLGHAAGDLLLQKIAAMYGRLVSDDCRVFRLGGDEFVFVVEGADEDKLQRLTGQIFASFSESILIEDMTLYVTVSLGVSLYPRDSQDLNSIVKNADMAMYVAKEQGGNAVHYFDEELEAIVTEKMFIDVGIREALKNDQFCLHYQPKIDTRTGRIGGLEALIRWEHPEQGIIPPNRFIPLAEDSGLILKIDEWVLREACRRNKAWQEQGLPKVPIAVNVSGRHFYQDNLLEVICSALEESGLEPQYLHIEITEGVLIKNVDQVLDTIMSIKKLGVQIAIDDFGTGYSSLHQLQRLPIYQVKLDRSFIVNVDSDPKKSSIVKAVIELAHSMNLKVVAEGIETIEEMKYLVELKCDELQGYYFSKPVPFEPFSVMLADERGFIVS